jgi:hypothetical protein
MSLAKLLLDFGLRVDGTSLNRQLVEGNQATTKGSSTLGEEAQMGKHEKPRMELVGYLSFNYPLEVEHCRIFC